MIGLFVKKAQVAGAFVQGYGEGPHVLQDGQFWFLGVSELGSSFFDGGVEVFVDEGEPKPSPAPASGGFCSPFLS